MDAFILFLHFVGLMIGAGGGISSAILMRRAAAMPPEQGGVIRSLGPLLANVSAIGLAVLWITGLILVFSKWGGIGALPMLFWIKLAFVVIATILAGLVHMTYAEMKRTGPKPELAGRLKMFGPLTGLSVFIAVLFAAYAFN